ncbi:helix-turn-helix domain-containing protein [Nocardia miyunensis]|uniref:helix-turn-helix domain-containing protein n=1 Tax=Nocardia miyunensis TaxID=282684 RepID=UPI0008321F86|nr:helix-turn-helix transcriptional regulator [Nocardia miyunensis]
MSTEQAPTLLRRQLGRFLRERRLEVGLTIARAAQEVQLSPAALQRMETGRPQKLRKQDVRALCELFDVDPVETAKAIELAEKAADNPDVTALGGMFSNAFNMYVGMEAAAQSMISYQELVPGLLQTAAYARALISTNPELVKDEDVERRVQVRLRRQKILTRRVAPLRLEVFLHESALRRIVGDTRTMATQLRHLAELGKQPNLTLRVHPYRAGCPWGILPGQFVILEFGDDAKGAPIEPPVVYRDGGMSSDIYSEDPIELQHYHELTEAIRRTALDDVDTRTLLRQVAREYDSDR